jgi:hypothetical protein
MIGFVKRTGDVLRRISGVICFTFVLVLPIGYTTDTTDTASWTVGVHGGYGRVASVLRSCEGEVLDSEGSAYYDVSASLVSPPLPVDHGFWQAGIRGGVWRAPSARFARSSGETSVRLEYLNPFVQMETKYVGLGLGLFLGDIPWEYNDLRRVNPEYITSDHSVPDDVPISAHLRIGNIDDAHFLGSFAECTPIVGGGGILNLGVGYRGSKWRGFSGFSYGFYDSNGFLQQVRFRAARQLDVDLALRIGLGGSEYEGSLGAGLVYNLGK